MGYVILNNLEQAISYIYEQKIHLRQQLIFINLHILAGCFYCPT